MNSDMWPHWPLAEIRSFPMMGVVNGPKMYKVWVNWHGLTFTIKRVLKTKEEGVSVG